MAGLVPIRILRFNFVGKQVRGEAASCFRERIQNQKKKYENEEDDKTDEVKQEENIFFN